MKARSAGWPAYIKGVAEGRVEIPLRVINEGFSIVSPAVTDSTFKTVIFSVAKPDHTGYPAVPAGLIPFISGEDAIFHLSKEDVAGKFTGGDRIKVLINYLVPGDIGDVGNPSKVYVVTDA